MSEQQSPFGHPGFTPTPGGPEASGGPTGSPGHGNHHGGLDGFFASVRRMGVTRPTDRWIGGVAAGIAQRFGLDPLLVRGIFVVSVLMSGAGLVLYGIGWAVLPERSDGRIHLQQAIRGQFDIALLGAVAAVIVGLTSSGVGLSWWTAAGLDWINGLLWLAALGAVAWLVISTSNGRKAQGGASGPSASPQPPSNPTEYPAAHTWAAPQWTTQDAPAPPDSQDAPTPPVASPTVTQPAPTAAPVPPPFVQADAPAAKAPQQPKASKRCKVPGPGPVLTGIVVGLSLLTGAGLLLVDRISSLPMPLAITWIGISLGLVGLGIIVAGLRGRRSGALGVLAIVGLAFAVSTDNHWSDGAWAKMDWGTGQFAMSGTRLITDPSVAEEGLSVGVGSPTYDLSELDLSGATAADPIRVPIELGTGSVRVIVPDGSAVSADVAVGTGRVVWDVDDAEQSERGGSGSRTYSFVSDAAAEGAVLVLDVNVGAGNLTITED